MADEKKGEEDQQKFAALRLAHQRFQAKCQMLRTNYIKWIKDFLFGHIITILLTKLRLNVKLYVWLSVCYY